MVDGIGTEYVDCSEVVLGCYPALVHDVRQHTETAAPQRHTFEVMRLALLTQQGATVLGAAQ